MTTDRQPFRLAYLAFFLGLLAVTSPSLEGQGKFAPARQPRVESDYIDSDAILAVFSAGPGSSTQGSGAIPSGQFAASFGVSTLLSHDGYSGGQGFLELGTLGPLPDRAAPAPFVGFNVALNHVFTPHPHNLFFLTGGIDYLFTQGGAVNGGIGFDHYYRENRAIRFELRDYVVFTERPQSTVAVRVGWVFSVHDP